MSKKAKKTEPGRLNEGRRTNERKLGREGGEKNTERDGGRERERERDEEGGFFSFSLPLPPEGE